MNFQLHTGDSLDILRTFPDNTFDAVITDPPYGLGKEPDAVKMLADWVEKGHHDVRSKRGFMGQEWDAFVPQPVLWAEVLRVLKPGGHLVAFAGTRTQDLMCLSLRLAGFEIRDMLGWIYSSGFPKSLNVGKAIEAFYATGSSSPTAQRKAAMGENYEMSPHAGEPGYGTIGNFHDMNTGNPGLDVSHPNALEWEGWGTALKPALEPITLARKPLDGTVVGTVLKWRTGAINVGGCRVEAEKRAGWTNQDIRGGQYASNPERPRLPAKEAPEGRWPANLIHDGSQEVLDLFPGHGDTSKARFFYCAKAQPKDRNAGLEGFEERRPDTRTEAGMGTYTEKGVAKQANHHPTVKPTSLMEYLCRLITPPGGLVLDPFMGSGSTGKAALREGLQFVGIDMNPEFVNIARARLEHEAKQIEKEIDDAPQLPFP